MGFKWLERYSGQTTDQLISLEKEYRVPSLVLAFEQAIAQKATRFRLTEEELIVLSVEALEREVNNGGYLQFFLNTPQFVSTIVPSLQRIGRPITAEITRKALEALRLPNLSADKVIAAVAVHNNERDADLRQYDDAYYNNTESIAVSLFEFIKENMDAVWI